MHYSFKSTPTWTLRTRPQTSDSRNPGPADYTVRKPLHHSGNVSAITQSRNLYKKFETFPGPGSYESKSYICQGQKRTMSAKHFQSVKPSPGPHEYQNNTIKVKNKAPKFSMSARSKSYHQLTIDKNLYTPGPTRYENKSNFDSKNGFVIGESIRKDLTQTQKTPAPNFYQSQKSKDFTLVSNKRAIMGTQFRKTTGFMEVQKTPGPDHYKSLSLFEDNKQKKVGFSCRQKTADLIAQQISKFPGPGEYQSHLKNKNRAPRLANTQTLRKTFMDDMQDYKKPYPSPDKYDPTMKSSKYNSGTIFNFSKSNRRPLDENEKTPGPLYYQNQKLGSMNSAPKFSVTKTIAKNQFLEVNPENPAPGSYNPKLILVKQSTKNYHVGKQKRPDFEKHKYLPGPGEYNLRGKQSSGSGWIFSKEQRIAFTDKNNQAKHGTHYNIPQKVVDPPKYMNVSSKIKYESPQKNTLSVFNTAHKSIQSQAE